MLRGLALVHAVLMRRPSGPLQERGEPPHSTLAGGCQESPHKHALNAPYTRTAVNIQTWLKCICIFACSRHISTTVCQQKTKKHQLFVFFSNGFFAWTFKVQNKVLICGFGSFTWVWLSHWPTATVNCLCCLGQSCLGELESAAEAAGRGQVQPRHARLHHERRLWR